MIRANRDERDAGTMRSRRVRVLVVGPSLRSIGGQSLQAARLVERLADSPDVVIAFLPVDPELPRQMRAMQRVKYLRTLVTSVGYIGSLLRALPRCDVVHAFSASYWSYLLAPLPAMALGRLLGRRVVLNYHSGAADDHLAGWPLSRRTMSLAHEIVVPSEYLVRIFARAGLVARAIPNFVEPGTIPHRSRAVPRPVLLCNRHFESDYDVGTVLRAFAIVQRELPDAMLLLAGDGSERPALESLALSLGLRNVRWTGRVTPDEMARLYDAADVLLNASVVDNMPLTILEAFAAGLPVASTASGGIPWIVRDGDTGLLVPVRDAAALARAALRLLREPGLAESVAARAREEYLARFRWSVVRRQWEEAYASARRPDGTTLAPARGTA